MIIKMGIEIREVAEQGGFEITRVYNEKWITNKILQAGAQKPGLALAGYLKYLNKDRIQIFGKTEIGYLNQLSAGEREKCLKNFLSTKIPGIVVSENQTVDESLVQATLKYKIPILVSNLRSSLLLPRISAFLYIVFSEKIKIYGVFMDIMGLGILITGESGIGKSETALELINKGHLLVSDDLVEFYLNSNDEPVGRPVEKIKDWLEVRGLGIINIVNLFGIGAVLREKRLDLVISLEKWNPRKKYDRLGVERHYFQILGKDIPMFKLPVALGRNLSTLIEVAVKYYISRRDGCLSFVETWKENIAGDNQKKIQEEQE